MAIKSYIAIPTNGHKTNLASELRKIEMCEIMPSENKDVIIILTDTHTNEQDTAILEKINSIEYLGHLTMVAGYETDSNP